MASRVLLMGWEIILMEKDGKSMGRRLGEMASWEVSQVLRDYQGLSGWSGRVFGNVRTEEPVRQASIARVGRGRR